MQNPSRTAFLILLTLITWSCTAHAASDRDVCHSPLTPSSLQDIDRHIDACTRATWQLRSSPHLLVAIYWARSGYYQEKGKFDPKNYDRAIDDCNYLITTVIPQLSNDVSMWRASAYGSRARAYHQKGDFERAITDYERAMQADTKPESVNYWREYLSDAREEFAQQQKEQREKREREARLEQERREQEARVAQQRLEQERLAQELETRQHDTQIFEANLQACAAYDVAACTAALQSAQGTNRYQDLLSMRRTAQQFNDDLTSCKGGSAAACDLALSFPNVPVETRQYVVAWREAASPWNKFVVFALAQFSAVRDYLSATPTSTLVASGLASFFGLLLSLLLFKQWTSSQQISTSAARVNEATMPAPGTEEVLTERPPPDNPPKSELAPVQPSVGILPSPEAMPVVVDPPEGMALKLKRSTKESTFGAKIYMLDARLDVSAEVRDLIIQHRLGKRLIYESSARQKHRAAVQGHLEGTRGNNPFFAPPAAQAKGAAKTMWKIGRAVVSAARASLALKITVDSLIAGVHVECKDMDELLEAEGAVREAKENIEGYISGFRSFDGTEEVV